MVIIVLIVVSKLTSSSKAKNVPENSVQMEKGFNKQEEENLGGEEQEEENEQEEETEPSEENEVPLFLGPGRTVWTA